jgi:hypothetical protein
MMKGFAPARPVLRIEVGVEDQQRWGLSIIFFTDELVV